MSDIGGTDGLTIRPGRDEDLPALVGALNAEERADGLPYCTTIERLRADLAHLPNHDPRRDLLVAELDGRIVGGAWASWAIRDGAYRHEHDGAVEPAVRGRGVGRALVHAIGSRIREVAGGHPGGPPSTVAAVALTGSRGERLLASEGYRPIRWFILMERPLTGNWPDAPLPPGIELRPVRPEHHRAIWEADVEAFRDHWRSREMTEEDFAAYVGGPDCDTSLWKVAWDGDRVAGVSRNEWSPDEDAALGVRRGWIGRLSVRRPWRGRGLARALLAASLVEFRRRGLERAILGVDAENPSGAVGLYERMGFAEISRAAYLERPV